MTLYAQMTQQERDEWQAKIRISIKYATTDRELSDRAYAAAELTKQQALRRLGGK